MASSQEATDQENTDQEDLNNTKHPEDLHSRLIEQWYLGIARYEKATAVKEKGRNISCGAASNVTVLLEK